MDSGSQSAGPMDFTYLGRSGDILLFLVKSTDQSKSTDWKLHDEGDAIFLPDHDRVACQNLSIRFGNLLVYKPVHADFL